jgi:hypothetical protein
MRAPRPLVLPVTGLLLVAFCAGFAAAGDDDAPLSPREIRDLEREIQHKERQLGDFESLMRKLKSAGRQTSHSPARSAVDETEKLMAEVILYEERKLGDDYVIKQHGEETETVHSKELTESRGVRTRNRRSFTVPAGTPPEYVRMVRLQEIYVSCQTLAEHAVARTGDAPERYGNLVREFADVMRADLAALQAKLPAKEDPGLYYPLRSDSTTAAPDSL